MEKQNRIHFAPTPFYKIAFTISLLFIFFFGLLVVLSYHRNTFFSESYKNLQISGKPSFATLVEYHLIENLFGKKYLYTYLVPDQLGKLSEVVESVDFTTHRKLRVGDTVFVRSQVVKYFGKEFMISRIENNSAEITISNISLSVGVLGLVQGFFFLITGFVLKFLHKNI